MVSEAPAAQAGRARTYEFLAVASSAGGVTALSRLLGGLPAEFPLPVAIVQHLDRRHETVIAEVLARRSKLRVKLAEAGERVEPGVVFVAPPNFHLLVETGGVLALSKTELVHFVRPSADLLFESAAAAYGDRVLACVLSGSGQDGARGVGAVHSRGGTVIVEDPDTAEFRGMPDAAVASGAADFVLPLDDIPPVICRLVQMSGS
jgi:two-component system, chemotaxis family, protein-glutamate methylesterase/glutaminase